jgi:hypothetical protein
MRKTAILNLALLSAIIISTAPLVHAANQSIDGVISDTMCGRNHMEPGKTDAECIQECMKGKVSYALVAGANIYTLAGKPQTIAAYAGKHVHVVGDIKDKTLTVKSIHEMKPEMQHEMDM